jgi:hypothetical protein
MSVTFERRSATALIARASPAPRDAVTRLTAKQPLALQWPQESTP